MSLESHFQECTPTKQTHTKACAEIIFVTMPSIAASCKNHMVITVYSTVLSSH